MNWEDRLYEAIADGDLDALIDIKKNNPRILRSRCFVSGSWLEFAASKGNLDVLKILVEFGLDVNELGRFGEARAIDGAAVSGHAECVRYLINNGSVLDTSDTTCNPLLNAIIGGSIKVVEILLDAGIDASVKYPHEKNTGAVAFALVREEPEIAEYIAKHLATDTEEFERLLQEAKETASKWGPLVEIPIIP